MANTILPGYETKFGNKNVIVVDHTGPSNYQQATEDVLNASDFGEGGFDVVIGSMDTTKTYFVEAIHSNTGGALSSLKLVWFVMAGTEVTNGTDLSAKTVRLTLIMV